MANSFSTSSASSPTTLEDAATIMKSYQDNCDYDLDEDPAKCNLFITACRKILASPQQFSRGGSSGHSLQMNLNLVADQLKASERWRTANVTTTSTKQQRAQLQHVKFTDDFRG